MVPFPHRAVHIDFHTMPGIGDFASEFHAEEFALTLKNAHVQYVNLFAKCNLGFCYFPTKVGTPYPTMKIDLFGEMLRACHKHGIGVSAYFNVGLSHEQALRHRDWCTVNADGKVYDFAKMDHWFRTMCFLTDYRKYITDLIDELLSSYPEVDGLIFDSMNQPPCHGIECIDAIEAAGEDIHDPRSATRQSQRNMFAMQQAIEDVITRHKPDLWRFYLGIPASGQKTHVEMEILPQGGWGYDYMPWYIRYIRTLGKPYSLMTGRFQRSWGDLAGIRPGAALEYDCFYAIACGAKISIGDHLHPRGRLNQEVYSLIGSIYEQVMKYEPYCDNAKSCADILLLAPHLSLPYDQDTGDSMRGIGRMLSELKCQYDVTDGDGVDFSGYKVLLLIDKVEITPELMRKIREFLAAGGHIISTGFAGVDLANKRFAIDELEQAAVIDPEYQDSYSFIRTVGGTEIPCYDKTLGMRLRAGGRSWGAKDELLRGYFQFQSFDYRHENLYIPPECANGYLPKITTGNITHLAMNVGMDYYHYASTQLRDYFSETLAEHLPVPVLTVKNLPSFAMVSLMRQEKRKILHILNYVPEKRGKTMEIIEDRLESTNVRITLAPDDSFAPREVRIVPSGEKLDLQHQEGGCSFVIPYLAGYCAVAIEE